MADSKSSKTDEEPSATKATSKGETVAEAKSQNDDVAAIVASKNIDGDEADAFTKVFIVPKYQYGDGYDHTPNFTGATQELVNVGLRPTGLVKFIGAEPTYDDTSVALTYRVHVLPASHDDAPMIVVDAQEVTRDGVTERDERKAVDGKADDPEHVIESGKPAPGTEAASE